MSAITRKPPVALAFLFAIEIDRNRRIVGKVLVGELDAGLVQVRAGMAWHYKAHESEQSAAGRVDYANAELLARKECLGLWRDDVPVPPAIPAWADHR